jgi:Sulfatase
MAQTDVNGGHVTHDTDELDDSPRTVRGQGNPHRTSVWYRIHLWALAELFVLSGFAIAQPLFDVIGRSPDALLIRRAGRLDIILLVLGVTVLPALGGWAIELLVGLVSARLRRLAHLVGVTGLFMMLAIQVAKKLTDLQRSRLIAVVVVAGTLAGVLVLRWSGLRLWLRYLTPAPVVFALLFLLVSPASTLVLPTRTTTGYSPNPTITSGAHPPVVMILFDEFPLSSLLDSKGQIDQRVYPNLAELASGSTWYRNATGVSGFTPWAMPAILTGRYPQQVKAPSYTEYPDNLLTLFGKYYDLKVYETISQLCPSNRCPATAGNLNEMGLRAVLDDSAGVFKDIIWPHNVGANPAFFVDQTDHRDVSNLQVAEKGTAAAGFRFSLGGLNQPSRFNDFLSGLTDSNRPTMHFLHILLPHRPWRYLPSGNEYNFKTLGLEFQSEQTPAPVVELNHQRHLLQTAYTDGLVGQVIDKLKAEGMWDKSLVVMSADHGQGWVPGEHARSLGRTNAPDLMWVPMFVKAPNQDNGKVDDRNWEQVDLLPTVADLAGVTVPWKMEGASQTGPPTRTRTEKWWYDIPCPGG